MDHMFDVVANVDDYKYFVPWCRNSKITETKAGHVRALLEVGFPPLIERYTSILTLVRPNLVKVRFLQDTLCRVYQERLPVEKIKPPSLPPNE